MTSTLLLVVGAWLFLALMLCLAWGAVARSERPGSLHDGAAMRQQRADRWADNTAQARDAADRWRDEHTYRPHSYRKDQ